MQSVVSFRPSASLDESFSAGPLRAAFAAYWECRFQSCLPIRALRNILNPPVPIRTVLVFTKLTLMRDVAEVTTSIADLADYLHSRVSELSRPNQLVLFPVDSPDSQSAARTTPNEFVSDLQTLVDKGRRFPTVYADPPWAYDNEASRAAARNHYPTMSVDQICAQPVNELAADDAHLHLWTTNGFLREAFDVIDAWGFQFKSCLVWVKDQIGMGNYWRVSHEFLLLGVRGSLTFRDRTIPSWLQSPRTVHSRKPGAVRMLIERVSPGPYIELFGRQELPYSDWTVFGNDIDRRLF